MTTFHALALDLSLALERKTRDNGETFVCLKDGSPEWMSDVCFKAHGDFLAEDWRYRFIETAANHFADDDSDPDEFHEAVDSAVDVYNACLTDWLSSNLNRIGYVDDAAAEYGAPSDGGIMKMIQIGQYAEIEEVFGLVAAALTELASDDDDGDDDATPFKVEGVEIEDGSRTLLAEFDNSGEARAFLNRYTATENAGNWNLIEVYDTRGEDSERLWFWERQDDDGAEYEAASKGE